MPYMSYRFLLLDSYILPPFYFLLVGICFLPRCYIDLLYLIGTSRSLFQLVPISANPAYHSNMNPP
jgi:hypothetical protein